MSRAGPSTNRNLSLTEELEKLEQSITLTLQGQFSRNVWKLFIVASSTNKKPTEIDHNFSKAHRIVTTSILPLVDQYGEHSRSVWEASKFWKQFFEASANVSLSGYEELANDGEGDTTALTTEESETTATEVRHGDESTAAEYTPRPRTRSGGAHDHHGDTTALTADQSSTFQTGSRGRGEDDSELSDADGDLTGSTPRLPATKTISSASRPQFAGLDSPYEAMKKREYKSGLPTARGTPSNAPRGRFDEPAEDEEEDTELLFQQHTARLPNMDMTPRSSLGQQALEDEEDDTQFGTKKTNKDPLLHRMGDKNFRVAATPHKGYATGVSPIKWKVTEKKPALGREKGKGLPSWHDSPMSSPEMAVPQLRSAAFMSPVRAAYKGRTAAAAAARGAPRTPGVSVQTPMTRGGKTKDIYGEASTVKKDAAALGGKYMDEIDWESDSEGDGGFLKGMSPPKTIQFALPPSKLMQTPGKFMVFVSPLLCLASDC